LLVLPTLAKVIITDTDPMDLPSLDQKDNHAYKNLSVLINYVKQRLLAPVHAWSMKLLAQLPMDGTFNQERPIERLRQKGSSDQFCFDLN